MPSLLMLLALLHVTDRRRNVVEGEGGAEGAGRARKSGVLVVMGSRDDGEANAWVTAQLDMFGTVDCPLKIPGAQKLETSWVGRTRTGKYTARISRLLQCSFLLYFKVHAVL